MAKPKRKNKKGSGYKPPPVDAKQVLADLEATVAKIERVEGAALGPLFGDVHKLLLKTDADKREAMRLIGMRDVDGIKRLIAQLRGGQPAVAEADANASDDRDAPEIDQETMRKAMKAFRKRLKLVRLDHESKLGVGPLTGGRGHGVDAIMAPQEYPPDVWEALVAAGELRHVGKEFYQLTSE